MPAYRYRAVASAGRVTRGTAAAANERELAYYLNTAGLELIEARVKREQRRLRLFARAVTPRALAAFCQQMADLLRADIPFFDALRDMGDSLEPGMLRDALGDIARRIGHGSRIAAAFARAPQIFPPVFTAILAAGERSGDLALTFAQLARYTDSRARLSENLRRALRYPLFLLAVTIGVVAFMMIMVVPQIVLFLNSINDQLPPITRLLIAVSDAFAKGWWVMGLLLIASLVFTMLARRLSARFACFSDGLLLRIPVVGPVVNKLILARFVESFAILLQSGIGIPASLRGARDTLGNRALEATADAIERQLQAGRALSGAMEMLLPPFAVRMLRMGERSGHLGKSCGDVATIYEREATDSVERLIGALEPALTILVGCILGWVVLAVLGPIYSSLSKMNVMS